MDRQVAAGRAPRPDRFAPSLLRWAPTASTLRGERAEICNDCRTNMQRPSQVSPDPAGWRRRHCHSVWLPTESRLRDTSSRDHGSTLRPDRSQRANATHRPAHSLAKLRQVRHVHRVRTAADGPPGPPPSSRPTPPDVTWSSQPPDLHNFGRTRFVLGNHCVFTLSKEEVLAGCGCPETLTDCSFNAGG